MIKVGRRTHSHPHEQMVYMLRGRIRFEHSAASSKWSWGQLSGSRHVEHQASALEDSEVLDILRDARRLRGVTTDQVK